MRFKHFAAYLAAFAALALFPLVASAEAGVTPDTTMAELRSQPSIAASGVYTYCYGEDMCESLSAYCAQQTLESYIGNNAGEDCAAALNLVIDNYNSGVQVTHKIYTPEQIATEPAKARAELYYFPSNTQNARYAIVVGGNFTTISGAFTEGFASVRQLHEMGYAVFVLRYRMWFDMGGNAPLDDLGAAAQYITAHAEEFDVQTANYAVIGYSAGGHLAGLFGSREVGWARFGVPKPGALILAYPINNYMEGKPVYHVFYDAFDYDWKYYWSNISDLVTADFPPVYFWYGQNDLTLKLLWLPEQCEALNKALERCGVEHKMVVYNNAPHSSSIGCGTDAEGWLSAAAAFWDEHTVLA